MTPDELAALVIEGDSRAVLEALRGLPERELRALAKIAVQLEKGTWKGYTGELRSPIQVTSAEDGALSAQSAEQLAESDRRGRVIFNRYEAACTAITATASASELIAEPWLLHHARHAFEALTARNPPWLREWAAKAVEKDIAHWELAHQLVTAGYCERPSSDNWCLGFIGHDDAFDDPIFAEREFWRCFELEGTPQVSFAARDRWGNAGWSASVLAAVDAGRIPRARLLDATLGALARDFVAFRGAWFSRMHEKLEPTLEERAARTDAYLGLLSCRVPQTVTFALKALTILDKAERLGAAQLLGQVGPALHARTKKSARMALGLVERAALRDPASARQAALLATEAFDHEANEVQARAIAFVTTAGEASDAELASLARERSRFVAATLKPRLLQWLGDEDHDEAERDARGRVAGGLGEEAAAAGSVVSHAAAQTPTRPLPHADSLDETIDLLGGAIERFDSPEEIEGALAGVARFCAERPRDFQARIGPLAKRASKILRGQWWSTREGWIFTGADLRSDLCRVVRAWHQGGELETPSPHAYLEVARSLRSMRALLAGRIREVALRAAAGRPGTLLATPTHSDGWIDAEALVSRALATGSEAPDPLDATQSLLRIAREGRSAASSEARAVFGEYGSALRFALGAEREVEESTSDLWLSAEAARTGSDPAPRRSLLHHPPVHDNYFDKPFMTASETLTMRWVATVFPADLDSYFRTGGSMILDTMSWRHALWWQPAFLEPLLRSDVPLTPSARRLLAAALASSQAAEGGLATDVLIQIVSDGRGNAAELGESFARLLCADIEQAGSYVRVPAWVSGPEAGELLRGPVSCARWAKRLQEVARASERHAGFVRDVLVRAIRGLPDPPPRDLASFLGLLRELCAETAFVVTDAEARAKLAGITGSGKAATIARALLDGERARHARS